MAKHYTGFKEISQSRLKSVKILILHEDWEMCAYIMGYVLECSLKAMICKKLCLSSYPDSTSDEISKFFKTHKFDPLLLLSGLSQDFSINGNLSLYQNWSNFTKEYQGDWPAMRYDPHRSWTEIKVKSLYENLTDSVNGIYTYIKARW